MLLNLSSVPISLAALPDIIEEIERHKLPFVEIRLIAMLHACHIPNDRLYKEQWNLKKIGAPEAWRIRTFAGSLTSAGSFQQPMKKWFSFSWVFKK